MLLENRMRIVLGTMTYYDYVITMGGKNLNFDL